MKKKIPLTINLPEEIEDNTAVANELLRLSVAAWEKGDFSGRVLYAIRAENHFEYVALLKALLIKQSTKGVQDVA